MRVERLGGANRVHVWLDDEEYIQILEAAPTWEAKLVARLAGEAGIRPVNICEVRMGETEVINGKHFAQVPNVRSRRGPEMRDVYLVDGLYEELQEFQQANDIADGTPLFDYVKRTIQGRVKDCARQAANLTGNDDYAKVSTSDLRRYYTTNLLFGDRVHLRVVMELGAWDHLDSLETYIPYPTREELFDELDRVTEVGGDV